MDIMLFEHDEFPIWVDLSTNKISCVGFCLCCPLSPERADCETTLPILAGIKAILQYYGVYPLCNIYKYYFTRKDFVKGIYLDLILSVEPLGLDIGEPWTTRVIRAARIIRKRYGRKYKNL